jgi:hypothetical protein
MARRPGAFIGADTGKKRARIKEELMGGVTAARVLLRRDFGPEEGDDRV